MAAALAADEESSAAVVELRCADLARFTVPAWLAAARSGCVARAVGAGERAVDLPRGVSGKGVAAVVAYWEARAAAAATGAGGAAVDLAEFDAEFVRALSHDAMIDLVHAAAPDYLDDQGLFNLFLA